MLAYAAIALAAFVCVPSFVTASGPTHLTYHTDKQYGYEKYPWHNSIELLWRTQWQPLSEHGIYPFDQYTNGTDFAGIFDRLISKYGDTSANDFDQNTWASFFLGPGRDVLSQAEQAERDGDIDQAKALYMRAATIFRIGYYPWVGLETQSKLKRRAWELEKKAFESGIRYEDLKFESLSIPYPDGTLSKELPFYVMSPKGKKNGDLHKVVLLISGLDHYRTGQIGDVLDLVSDGFGVVVVDMPGTGDAPISGRNTNADAAYWEAIMSWIEQNSQQRSWDLDNVWAWGLSTGSYYSIKISRTQHKRLRGVLAQSAASHYTFKPDWLKSSDHLSYPVALWSTLGYAFGYQDKNEFAKNAEKYSLLRQGVLDKKSAPLTMVNGLDDTVFPIDDGIILSLHGDGAKLRIFQGQGHMGQPASGPFVSSFWKEVASAP